ncbi:SMP-30/Gluconolaconase/LRE domain-containing protein [Mollisia scopiformis]|uniref:SMP-30/Gluconolaconase/LRE domain-containing protein n=1 Tax=Mollisia scopiformis TaxID=149040 RepID=A0A194WXC8_MOLSC|nr:SMP-30/Gluconolaconase/LRE domain-containing protein [Mollisia scopiformis]KUJ12334.1 SMP-30/Gluconolaconase/LRE domain-containing protein [Mollisia scopiformis]
MPKEVQTIDGGKAWYKCKPGPMVLGEAPIYRASDNTLHWVDPLKEPPELHILHVDPETGNPKREARVLVLEDSVTVQYFRKDIPGSYICAYYQGVAFMDEETGKLEVVKEIIPKEERGERRFNDGGVDAKGRFWLAEIDKKAMIYGAGNLPESYGTPRGRLWRYDPDGSLHEMASGFVCGNAVDWSRDNKIFYINDSVGQKVYSFDFDLESGSISNRKLLVDMAGTVGEPDGMVISTDGSLHIAVYGTNTLMVFDPAGKHLKSIKFSGKNLTCPTWGGKDHDMLFITSARQGAGDDTGLDEGGNIFSHKVGDGVKGLAKNEFGG